MEPSRSLVCVQPGCQEAQDFRTLSIRANRIFNPFFLDASYRSGISHALPALANLGESIFHMLADGWHICFPESWFRKNNKYSNSLTQDLSEVLYLS